MSAYRYYSNEAKRHRDIADWPVSKEKISSALQALCKRYGLPTILLRFHKKPKNARGAWSWYQSAHVKYGKRGAKKVEEHISISDDHLNLLTLAHEWAHYAHRHDYDRRKRVHSQLPPERSHGRQHLELTEQAVKFLRDEGWTKPSTLVVPAKPAAPRAGSLVRDMLPAAMALVAGRNVELLTDAEKAEISLKVREQYMAALPAQLTCPCCSRLLPHLMFGARVMTKSEQGLPQRVSRQSQCISCRNKKKET